MWRTTATSAGAAAVAGLRAGGRMAAPLSRPLPRLAALSPVRALHASARPIHAASTLSRRTALLVSGTFPLQPLARASLRRAPSAAPAAAAAFLSSASLLPRAPTASAHLNQTEWKQQRADFSRALSSPNPYLLSAASVGSASAAAPSPSSAAPDAAAATAASAADPVAALQQSLAETAAEFSTAELPPTIVPLLGDSNSLLHLAANALSTLHTTTGLPWWATLVLSGVFVRGLLFPLQVYQARVAASMAGLEPHFMLLDLKARASPATPFAKALVLTRLKWHLYNKYGCNPLKLLVPSIAQIGVYVLLASALRFLVRSDPSLATGGTLWFANLAVADPTYVLPIAAMASSYASSMYLESVRRGEARRIQAKAVEAITQPSYRRKAAEEQAKKEAEQKAKADSAAADAAPPPAPATHSPMDNLMHYSRGLTVLFIPWILDLPAGLFFFWLTSVAWTLCSSRFFRHPAVRDRLGLTRREDTMKHEVAARAAREDKAPKAAEAERQPKVAYADRQLQKIREMTEKRENKAAAAATKQATTASPASTSPKKQ